jgi:hypothetical protein
MLAPTLNLNFTAAIFDPRITFARTDATATRVNSSGFIEVVSADAPRFDFDPLTLSCRGLLVEEAKTNFRTNSNNFSAWSQSQVIISPDALVSPDGTASADKLIQNTTSTFHFISQAFTPMPGTTYTHTIYAKAGEYYGLYIFGNNPTTGANAPTRIDLRTGVYDVNGHAGTITDAGGGWYRIATTHACPIASLILNFYVLQTTAAVAQAGDGTSGIYIYGAQLEAGASTSYIPTDATVKIRNADTATITGTNFSGLWSAGKGSALARARPGTVSGIRPCVQFDDTTADNIIALRGNTTNPELYVRSGGSDQAQIDAGTIAANASYRLSGAWAENSCAASLNSGAPVLDGVATIPVVTQARIGSDGTNYLNGHIEAIEYYDERIPNSALQVVSSTAGYQSIIGSVFRDAIIS